MGNSAPTAKISPHQIIPPGGRIPEGYFIQNGIIRPLSEKSNNDTKKPSLQNNNREVVELYTAQVTPTSTSLPGRQRDDTGVVEDIDDK